MDVGVVERGARMSELREDARDRPRVKSAVASASGAQRKARRTAGAAVFAVGPAMTGLTLAETSAPDPPPREPAKSP